MHARDDRMKLTSSSMKSSGFCPENSVLLPRDERKAEGAHPAVHARIDRVNAVIAYDTLSLHKHYL